MGRWLSLNLSWSARIASVKMTTLPKLNFLFQHLPINIEERILNKWQSQINKFIWNNKRARISFKVLQDDTKRGGLKVPNIGIYYHSAKLVWLIDWIKNPFDSYMVLEKSDLGCALHDVLWPTQSKKSVLGQHWLRNSLIKTWRKFQARISPNVSPLKTPMESLFDYIKPVVNVLLTYGDLVEAPGCFKKPSELSEYVSKLDWFSYNQLISKCKDELSPSGGSLRELTEFEQIIKSAKSHLLSKVHKLLLKYDTEEEQVKNA